jgi:hypothetical protein
MNSIEESHKRKKLKNRNKKEIMRKQKEKDEVEGKQMIALLKDDSITRILTQFLTFKEYNNLGAISQRFYKELRG